MYNMNISDKTQSCQALNRNNLFISSHDVYQKLTISSYQYKTSKSLVKIVSALVSIMYADHAKQFSGENFDDTTTYTLMEMTDLSKKTVLKYTKELEEKEILEITRHAPERIGHNNVKSKPTTYKINHSNFIEYLKGFGIVLEVKNKITHKQTNRRLVNKQRTYFDVFDYEVEDQKVDFYNKALSFTQEMYEYAKSLSAGRLNKKQVYNVIKCFRDNCLQKGQEIWESFGYYRLKAWVSAYLKGGYDPAYSSYINRKAPVWAYFTRNNNFKFSDSCVSMFWEAVKGEISEDEEDCYRKLSAIADKKNINRKQNAIAMLKNTIDWWGGNLQNKEITYQWLVKKVKMSFLRFVDKRYQFI